MVIIILQKVTKTILDNVNIQKYIWALSVGTQESIEITGLAASRNSLIPSAL